MSIAFGKGQGRDARQAGRAFDASEESADEDGVEAEMYEFSEHFRMAHNNGWVRDGQELQRKRRKE